MPETLQAEFAERRARFAAEASDGVILVLGGRSFSIWSEDGQQVYDSGSDFERITARLNPLFFNASNDNNNLDDRSDNKGPEPEGVALGKIAGRTFAFIGLERIGGMTREDFAEKDGSAGSRLVLVGTTGGLFACREGAAAPAGPAAPAAKGTSAAKGAPAPAARSRPKKRP